VKEHPKPNAFGSNSRLVDQLKLHIKNTVRPLFKADFLHSQFIPSSDLKKYIIVSAPG
jgi:hypothetical protein